MKELDKNVIDKLRNTCNKYSYFFNYSGIVPKSFDNKLKKATLILFEKVGSLHITALTDTKCYDIGSVLLNEDFANKVTDYIPTERDPKKTERIIELLLFMAAHSGISAEDFMSSLTSQQYESYKKNVNSYLESEKSFDDLQTDKESQPINFNYKNTEDGVNVSVCGKTRGMYLANFTTNYGIYIDQVPVFIQTDSSITRALWECYKPDDLALMMAAAIYEGYYPSWGFE